MSESITQKANRYLTEGRVRVIYLDSEHGEFEVAGTQSYLVKAMPWMCNCPAHVILCAHVLACQKISTFDEIRKAVFVSDDDTFLQDLLGD